MSEKFEVGDVQHSLELIQNTAIKTIHSLTKNVYARVMHIQENCQKIITLSSQWINIPMYSREKSTNLITFGDRLTEIKTTRCTEIRDASIKIQIFLKEDLLLFHNVPLVDPNQSKLIKFINKFPINIIGNKMDFLKCCLFLTFELSIFNLTLI